MIIPAFIFIVGLLVGSFINALEYRIENKKSITGRSFCPQCKHQLVWYDLIPLFSWLFLKARCRYCQKSISFQYPLVELLTGTAFVIAASSFGFTKKLNNFLFQTGTISLKDFFSLILVLFIVFVFILNAVHDYKTSYLLSAYIYVGVLAAVLNIVISLPIFSLSNFAPYLLSAAIPALLFFSLSFFSKGKWMGEGDWELAFLMGLFLGYPNIVIALYFAFIVGSVIGLLGIYQEKFKMRTAIPFGPYLIAGTFFALLFGEKIFSFYVKIILGY